LNEIETAWLAGLLEGEGCFAANGKHGIKIMLQMTDKDVVEKAAKLLEVNLSGFQDERPHRKATWRFQLCGDRAVQVMEILLPFMGERRTVKIKRLLLQAKNRVSQQEAGRRGSRSGMSMSERGRRGALASNALRRDIKTLEMF